MDPALCVVYLSHRQQEVKSKQLALEVRANSKAWVVLRPGHPNPWQSDMVGEALRNVCCPKDLEHIVRWPLTMAHLIKLKDMVWQKGQAASFVMVRDVCAVWLAFYAMLRCSEVVRLWMDNVKVERTQTEPAVVRVWIQTSKTDPDGKGEWVSCVGEELAQVVERYGKVRGSFAGPFFMKQPAYRDRAQKRRENEQKKREQFQMQPARGRMFLPPLSVKQKGKDQKGSKRTQKEKDKEERGKQEGWRVSKATLTHRLRELLQLVGLSEQDQKKYSWHSCRAGGATEAIRQGVTIQELSRLGRWKSEAVEVYVWLNEREAGQATKDFGRGLERSTLVSAEDIQHQQPTVPLVPYAKRT